MRGHLQISIGGVFCQFKSGIVDLLLQGAIFMIWSPQLVEIFIELLYQLLSILKYLFFIVSFYFYFVHSHVFLWRWNVFILELAEDTFGFMDRANILLKIRNVHHSCFVIMHICTFLHYIIFDNFKIIVEMSSYVEDIARHRP